jgi:ketosteroid isomerase-like protein
MSQEKAGQALTFEEKADLCRRSYAAFSRGDIEGMVALYTEDCEWDWSHFADWPEQQIYRGHEGLRKAYEDFIKAWQQFEVQPAEILDAGEDRLFIRCHMRVKGKTSGADIEATWAQVAEIRQGKGARVVNFSAIDEALEAAGLRK